MFIGLRYLNKSLAISLPTSPSNPLNLISGIFFTLFLEHLFKHRFLKSYQFVVLLLFKSDLFIKVLEERADLGLFFCYN